MFIFVRYTIHHFGHSPLTDFHHTWHECESKSALILSKPTFDSEEVVTRFSQNSKNGPFWALCVYMTCITDTFSCNWFILSARKLQRRWTFRGYTIFEPYK